MVIFKRIGMWRILQFDYVETDGVICESTDFIIH